MSCCPFVVEWEGEDSRWLRSESIPVQKCSVLLLLGEWFACGVELGAVLGGQLAEDCLMVQVGCLGL